MREKLDQIKDHFIDHREAYFLSGFCFASGVAAALIVSSRPQASSMARINAWKSTVNLSQTTTLVRRGHPGNIIKCVETGELFASQNRAAQVMGIDASNLGKHLNGFKPHAGGFTFENLGANS